MKEILRLAPREHSQEPCLLHKGKKKDIQNGKKPVISETEFLEAFMSMKSMMEILLDERVEWKKIEEGFAVKFSFCCFLF